MNRATQPLTIIEATAQAPTLARLAELGRQSAEWLQAVDHLLPPNIKPAIVAGPIDGTAWCLLVSSNAACAKLRQLVPAIQACLRGKGWEVNSIRLKVQIQRK